MLILFARANKKIIFCLRCKRNMCKHRNQKARLISQPLQYSPHCIMPGKLAFASLPYLSSSFKMRVSACPSFNFICIFLRAAITFSPAHLIFKLVVYSNLNKDIKLLLKLLNVLAALVYNLSDLNQIERHDLFVFSILFVAKLRQ